MTRADDESLHEHYADPDNRVAGGPPRRRATRPLTSHVPVRFSPELVAEVKALANLDRKTVSSWIRDVIEGEVERRQPCIPETVAMRMTTTEHWVTPPGATVGMAATAMSGEARYEPLRSRRSVMVGAATVGRPVTAEETRALRDRLRDLGPACRRAAMSWAPSRTGVMHLAREGRAACAWTTRLLAPHGQPDRWCKHCAAYDPPRTRAGP